MLARFLGYQWFAIAMQGVISFALAILIARTFGPEMFGVYSVALSVGVLLAILIDGGFGVLLQREAVRATTDIGFDGGKLHGYAFGQALLVIGGLIVLVLLGPLPFNRPTLLAVICAFGMAVIGQFFLAILRGQGRLARDAMWQLVNRGVTAICVLAVLWWGANQPWQVFAAQAFGSVAIVLYLVRMHRVKPILPVPLAVYRAVLPMLWFNLLSVIYHRADMVLLKLVEVPRSEIGYYGVAFRMMELVLLLAAPIALILFRRFRLNFSSGTVTLVSVLKPVAVAALIGLAIFGLYAAVGGYVISLAFGKAYSPAAGLLTVLAFSLVFALPNGVLLQAAMSVGLERWCALGATVAALVNVSANVFLLPRYGIAAAAWIAVVTEMVVGLLLVYGLSLRRRTWAAQNAREK